MCKKFYLLNIIFILFLATILGCSDSVPDVVSSKSSVIFTYDDYESKPNVRLAVFLEVSSDPRRVETISISSIKDNMKWLCEEPVVFSESNKKMVGYTNFVTPNDVKIPTGSYKVVYTDAQGRFIESFTYVSYPEDLMESNVSESEEFLGLRKKEYIAIYNSNDEILYFGDRKKHWTEDSIIFAGNKDYVKFRRCINMIDDSVICLFPFVTKESINNDIEKKAN